MAAVIMIEDDPRIREALSRALQLKGHDVDAYGRGFPALDAVVSKPPDVVILDMGLPDIDGSELLRELRKVSDVPVVVATARDRDEDIVATLHAGADDYIVKPFSIEQVDARIGAVLRRVKTTAGATFIEVGGIRIDPRRHYAVLDGQTLDLNRKEFELLLFLAMRPGIVVSKQELLAEVWRQPWGGSEKTVDVHLSWLRKKLGETASEPRYLRAVRGVGVTLTEPETVVEQ